MPPKRGRLGPKKMFNQPPNKASTSVQDEGKEYQDKDIVYFDDKFADQINEEVVTCDLDETVLESGVDINVDQEQHNNDLAKQNSKQPEVKVEIESPEVKIDIEPLEVTVDIASSKVKVDIEPAAVEVEQDYKSLEQSLEIQDVSKTAEFEEKRFEWNRSFQFKGSQFEKVNNLNGKMCFVPAIPYSKTQFWNDGGQKLPNSEILYITGGSLTYSITNIAGPAISIDLYKIYDVRPDKEFDFLTQRTVRQGWTKDFLQDKFRFVTRMEKATLESGEILRLDSRHKQAETLVAKLKDRQYIPCYLTLLWNLTSTSEIQISLFNNIEYKCMKKDEPINSDHANKDTTSVMLPKDLFEIVSTWKDDDEFE